MTDHTGHRHGKLCPYCPGVLVAEWELTPDNMVTAVMLSHVLGKVTTATRVAVPDTTDELHAIWLIAEKELCGP